MKDKDFKILIRITTVFFGKCHLIALRHFSASELERVQPRATVTLPLKATNGIKCVLGHVSCHVSGRSATFLDQRGITHGYGPCTAGG